MSSEMPMSMMSWIDKQQQENNVYRALGAGGIQAKCGGCHIPLTPPARAAFSHPALCSQRGHALPNRPMGSLTWLASSWFQSQGYTRGEAKDRGETRPGYFSPSSLLVHWLSDTRVLPETMAPVWALRSTAPPPGNSFLPFKPKAVIALLLVQVTTPALH